MSRANSINISESCRYSWIIKFVQIYCPVGHGTDRQTDRRSDGQTDGSQHRWWGGI